MCILNYQQQLFGETVNTFTTIYMYLQVSLNIRAGLRTKIWETSVYKVLALHNVKLQHFELQNGLIKEGIYTSEIIKSSQYNNLLIKKPISHYMSHQISGLSEMYIKLLKFYI